MPAPKDERQAVLAANRDFYRAFEQLDAARMGEVWLAESYVSCTHPGWGRILGWGPVMKSWEEIFAGTFGVKIAVSDEVTHIHGDLAWVTCTEDLETRLPDGVSHGRVEATNVFERRDGAWLVVHHHGSPLVRGYATDDDRQLH
jgi:ketosteroid isomerase-like protein